MKKYIPVVLSVLLTACGGSGNSGVQNKSNLSAVSESAAGNDDYSSAQSVAVNSIITGSVNAASDPEDYYSFDVKQGNTISINLSCPSEIADIELSLYNSGLGTVLYSNESGCTEEMTYDVPEDMVMYISVEFSSGDPSDYSLEISSNGVDSKDDTATAVDPGTATGLQNDVYESCTQLYADERSFYSDNGVTVEGTCPGNYDYQCRVEGGIESDSDLVSYYDMFLTKEFIESTWGNSITIEDFCKNNDSSGSQSITYTLTVF